MSDPFKGIPMSQAIDAAPYLPPADRVFTFEEIAAGYDRIASEGWGVRIEEAPAWKAGPDGVPADRDVWAYVYDYHHEEDVALLRGRYDGQFREFKPAGTKGSLTTSVLAWIDTDEQPAFGIEAVRACIASLAPLADNCHDEIAHVAEDWLHREALRAVVFGHPDAKAIAEAALESRQVMFTRYYS